MKDWFNSQEIESTARSTAGTATGTSPDLGSGVPNALAEIGWCPPTVSFTMPALWT